MENVDLQKIKKSTLTIVEKIAIILNIDVILYGEEGYNHFNQLYSKLVMINPTKAKFRETVVDYHFYELMRIYSNALERSSSLLIVAGFSFADEHIANITMRAANANPTLQVIIFAYNGNERTRVYIQTF